MQAISKLLSECWTMMQTLEIPGLSVSFSSFLIAVFLFGFATTVIAKLFSLSPPSIPSLAQSFSEGRRKNRKKGKKDE